MTQSQLPTTPNLGTRLRSLTEGGIAQMGARLHRLGIHPDVLTWAGLALVAVGAALIARGQFVAAVIVLVLSLPLDALDGAVARAMRRTNPFGGVLDSAVDRYADLFLLLGLAYYLAVLDRFGLLLLTFAAVVGSTLVSYIRARAGAAGLPTAGGFFSRLERLVVLVLTLLLAGLFGPDPWLTLGLVILAVGSNLTALHRLWSVSRFAQAMESHSSVEQGE